MDRSSAPYTSAKIAMNVYPTVSERPEARPLDCGPQRSIVIKMVLVHVMPWLIPRKADEPTKNGHAFVWSCGNATPQKSNTTAGPTKPTRLPNSAIGLRPCVSANPPTSKLQTALHNAYGTRNEVFPTYPSMPNSRPAPSRTESLFNCRVAPTTAVIKDTTTS